MWATKVIVIWGLISTRLWRQVNKPSQLGQATARKRQAASGNWKSERLTNFVLSRRHLGHYPFTVAPSSRRGQALLVSFLRANNISGTATAAAVAAVATGWEAVAASCELMLRLAHCAVSLSLSHTVVRSPAGLFARSLNEHKFNGKMAFNCNRQCETFSGQVLPTRFHQATCRRYSQRPTVFIILR